MGRVHRHGPLFLRPVRPCPHHDRLLAAGHLSSLREPHRGHRHAARLGRRSSNDSSPCATPLPPRPLGSTHGRDRPRPAPSGDGLEDALGPRRRRRADGARAARTPRRRVSADPLSPVRRRRRRPRECARAGRRRGGRPRRAMPADGDRRGRPGGSRRWPPVARRFATSADGECRPTGRRAPPYSP